MTLVSTSSPTNLDVGETLSPGGGPPDSFVAWSLDGSQLNKQYTFTVVIYVSNASSIPFEFNPAIHIGIGRPGSNASVGTASSIVVPVPSLDGPSPGSGSVTFSVDQTAAWEVFRDERRELSYESLYTPTSTNQCKNGGWKAFGVFKNRGDCVSNIATRDKNAPGTVIASPDSRGGGPG